MEPVLEALTIRYAGSIRFIEVDGSEAVGQRLIGEYRVSGSPTYVFLYGDGFEAGRLVGRQTAEDMEAALDILLDR